MKKTIAPVFFLACLILSCNNEEKKPENNGHHTTLKTPADSLMHDVMEGHDAVMPKMSKVRTAQKQAQQMLDSISALSNKAQQMAASLKTNLESLVNELNNADFAMDKWMSEFNMDSAKDNMEQRIKYLTDEKLKVAKVKEAVLNGLTKADSLLKTGH